MLLYLKIYKTSCLKGKHPNYWTFSNLDQDLPFLNQSNLLVWGIILSDIKRGALIDREGQFILTFSNLLYGFVWKRPQDPNDCLYSMNVSQSMVSVSSVAVYLGVILKLRNVSFCHFSWGNTHICGLKCAYVCADSYKHVHVWCVCVIYICICVYMYIYHTHIYVYINTHAHTLNMNH